MKLAKQICVRQYGTSLDLVQSMSSILFSFTVEANLSECLSASALTHFPGLNVLFVNPSFDQLNMNKIYLLRAVGCANDPSPCLLASAPLTSKWYKGGCFQFLLTRDLKIGAAINELGVFHSVRFQDTAV